MKTRTPPFRLLFVGSRAVSGDERFLDVLEAALLGGVDAFLLREKGLSGGKLLELAGRCRELTRRHGATLLVSDRVDVALAAGAEGVQLPENSFSPDEARQIGGDRLRFGRSVHSREGAARAAEAGADWLMAGPVFPTPGKPDPMGIETAAHIRATTTSPVIPVGGIDSTNVALLASAGFGAIAVIRAIAAAGDPESAARSLIAAMTGPQ